MEEVVPIPKTELEQDIKSENNNIESAVESRAPGEWYVVHTYSGYENKIKVDLSKRVE